MSQWSNAIARVNAAQLRTFGEVVTFEPANSGTPVSLTVIWDAQEARMPEGVRATAWFLESDLPGVRVQKNDIIRRGFDTYRVVEQQGVVNVERDGTGGIKVYLRQKDHAPNP